jgi:hypothetical protein
MRWLLVVALLVAESAGVSAQRPAASDRPGYLYVWATAMDTAPTIADTAYRPRRLGVFLAAVDLRDGSPTRGRVVHAVMAADTAARNAHHTEHALAADGLLFANDFGAGRTYRFDLRTAGAPRLVGDFTTAGPYAFPHSFVRLANGHVLATYQRRAAGSPPGGLVELARDGTAIRWTSAGAAGVDSAVLQPYSIEVIPSLDRVVTTSTSMTEDVGVHVQVWRLSDLRLLHTLALPEAPAAPADHAGHAMPRRSARDTSAAEMHHLYPGEPRLLADGRSVMLGTFTCGVYLLTGVERTRPRLAFAGALPGGSCAVPARVGRWWVQTVPSLHGLVSLDVSDPAHPREASRLAFGAAVRAHWLSADASGSLLAMDSGIPTDPRVYLVALDRRTGALAPDATLPVIDLARVDVPGLGIVRAAPHGAVFGATRP